MFNKSLKKQNCYVACPILWLVSVLMPVVCQAEFQDPTRPDYPKPTATDSHNPAAAEKLVLSAIWITGSGKWATINGVTAKPGQIILNQVKVIKISRNAVSISHNGRIKKLQLLRPLTKSQ